MFGKLAASCVTIPKDSIVFHLAIVYFSASINFSKVTAANAWAVGVIPIDSLVASATPLACVGVKVSCGGL